MLVRGNETNPRSRRFYNHTSALGCVESTLESFGGCTMTWALSH